MIGDKQKFKTDNIESEEEEGSDSEKGKPNSPFDHKKDSGDRGNDRRLVLINKFIRTSLLSLNFIRFVSMITENTKN